ncbi:unnamed protein product [Clavelina lepadiformis]|uniref:Profilin n=1 Tax=Clavelina lepadiformis TaxID=159417 RepID=A0ABP0GLH1_CLALP
MSPKVDWENVCDEILGVGGQATEYVYLGTENGKMGEKDISGRFRKFSEEEASIIANSNGSNFQFRGEEHRFVRNEDEIFFYESFTRKLAYGKISKYILIVCGHGHYQSKVFNRCHKALRFGLNYIKTLEY